MLLYDISFHIFFFFSCGNSVFLKTCFLFWSIGENGNWKTLFIWHSTKCWYFDFFLNFQFFFSKISKKNFFFQFSKLHIFFKNYFFVKPFTVNRVNKYILNSVDGIFMKINICWFRVIFEKIPDFGHFLRSMGVLFGHICPWETDKVPKCFFDEMQKCQKMCFHTLSKCISSKMSVIFPFKPYGFCYSKSHTPFQRYY